MPVTAIIDHIAFDVTDFQKSLIFYSAIVEPLGLLIVDRGERWAMIGRDTQRQGGDGQITFSEAATTTPFHFAFRAPNRESVDGFYDAAIKAGGRDNGPPGLRPHYRPDYYAAFVLDPDGHNVEAVFLEND